MHNPPATTMITHENQTGTEIDPTCTGHWLKARTACATVTMPKMMPETGAYIFFTVPLPVEK